MMDPNYRGDMSRLIWAIAWVNALFLMAGCGQRSRDEAQGDTSTGPFPVQIKADWYAQPEHGGFYLASEMGFYQEVGLAAEVIPGNPQSITRQKVAKGEIT